jgi:methionine-rich copper-binding protein CopC
MKRRHIVLLLAILALPVAAGGDRLATQSPASKAPAFASGQVLTLDASGKITQNAPQTSALRDALGEALSTSSEGQVEVKSTVPGGGYMVDLQGRFQNAMTVTVDEDGNISAPCITGTSEQVKAAGEVE